MWMPMSTHLPVKPAQRIHQDCGPTARLGAAEQRSKNVDSQNHQCQTNQTFCDVVDAVWKRELIKRICRKEHNQATQHCYRDSMPRGIEQPKLHCPSRVHLHARDIGDGGNEAWAALC